MAPTYTFHRVHPSTTCTPASVTSTSRTPFRKRMFIIFSSFISHLWKMRNMFFFNWTYTSSVVCVLTLKVYFVFSPQCWQMAPSVLLRLFFCCACHLHLHIMPFFGGIFLAANGKGKKKRQKLSPTGAFLCFFGNRASASWLILSSIHLYSFGRPCHPMR